MVLSRLCDDLRDFRQNSRATQIGLKTRAWFVEGYGCIAVKAASTANPTTKARKHAKTTALVFA